MIAPSGFRAGSRKLIRVPRRMRARATTVKRGGCGAEGTVAARTSARNMTKALTFSLPLWAEAKRVKSNDAAFPEQYQPLR
jgi:hypothetical protein